MTANTRYWDGDIPWISAASLKDFDVRNSDRRITRLAASDGSRLVAAGSVLFVVRGMSLKNEFRVGVTRREVAFGQDCKAIIPRPDIDARFLAYSLVAQSALILSMVDEAGHGTGRLPTDQIAKLVIGVPDLAEQQRIVEILDAADKSIRSTERLITKLEAARRSCLLRDIPDSRGGELRYLGEYLSHIEAGWSPSCDEVPPVFGEWGVLKVSAVTGGAFNSHEAKRLPRHLKPKPEIEVKQGDILVARANGVAELVGIAVQVGELAPRLMLSDKTLRVVPNEGLLTESFLVLLLGSPMVRRQIMEMISGSSGQKNISQAQLRRLAVAVPTLHDQARIVAVNKSFLDQIRAYQKEVVKLRKIRQGLMEDLLTGRVRVKDAEEQVEAEV